MVGENLKNAVKDMQKFQTIFNFIEESLGKKNKITGISKEIVIDSKEDEKTLILKLSALHESSGISYIIVLEDISTVAKAQRQIAWSEIARRLAHEIKNPLTPIQLSAERVQNKIIGKLNEADKELLNKSTNTIIKQVDALKLMVNEFAEYSRTPSVIRKIGLPIRFCVANTASASASIVLVIETDFIYNLVLHICTTLDLAQIAR